MEPSSDTYNHVKRTVAKIMRWEDFSLTQNGYDGDIPCWIAVNQSKGITIKFKSYFGTCLEEIQRTDNST